MVQYGDRFIVTKPMPGHDTLNIADVILRYQVWTTGMRQARSIQLDMTMLKAIAVSDFMGQFSIVTRQWAGHKVTPAKVNGKYQPLFVSHAINWS